MLATLLTSFFQPKARTGPILSLFRLCYRLSSALRSSSSLSFAYFWTL